MASSPAGVSRREFSGVKPQPATRNPRPRRRGGGLAAPTRDIANSARQLQRDVSQRPLCVWVCSRRWESYEEPAHCRRRRLNSRLTCAALGRKRRNRGSRRPSQRRRQRWRSRRQRCCCSCGTQLSHMRRLALTPESSQQRHYVLCDALPSTPLPPHQHQYASLIPSPRSDRYSRHVLTRNTTTTTTAAGKWRASMGQGDLKWAILKHYRAATLISCMQRRVCYSVCDVSLSRARARGGTHRFSGTESTAMKIRYTK